MARVEWTWSRRERSTGFFVATLLALLLATDLAGPGVGHASARVVPCPSSTPAAGNATTYLVNVTVIGLPAGTPWSLNILQQSWNTTAPTILLREPNGTYSYTASSVDFPGNRFSNGSFVVAGQPVNVVLRWTPPSNAGSPNGTATSSATATLGGSLFVVIVFVLVIGIVVALAVIARGSPTTFRQAADQTPLGAPGADRGSEPRAPDSPDDPLGHML